MVGATLAVALLAHALGVRDPSLAEELEYAGLEEAGATTADGYNRPNPWKQPAQATAS